jgi:hypothetical protein
MGSKWCCSERPLEIRCRRRASRTTREPKQLPSAFHRCASSKVTPEQDFFAGVAGYCAAMDWHAAETYVDALNAGARRTLLRILTSPPEIRAAAIGRLHVRDDGADLAGLLIELEEKEWARQWFVERLRS